MQQLLLQGEVHGSASSPPRQQTPLQNAGLQQVLSGLFFIFSSPSPLVLSRFKKTKAARGGGAIVAFIFNNS